MIVAQKLAGREKEIGDGMANIYANEFSEQELKDLVTFYKSPLGQKLLAAEPQRHSVQSMAYHEPAGRRISPKSSTANSAPRCASAARRSEAWRVASSEWKHVARRFAIRRSPFAFGIRAAN